MHQPQPQTRLFPVSLIVLSAFLFAACQSNNFPALVDVSTERNLLVNQAISAISFDNNGDGKITSCASNPTLPAGLTTQPNADSRTCEIVGIPTASANRATYTITATNRRGPNNATITLTVFANLISPALVNPSSQQSYNTGSAIEDLIFTNNGGESITQCTAKPALPAGLRLIPNAITSTCVIQGTPTAASPRTTHTIAARNSAGTSNAIVTIAVNMGAEPSGAPVLVAPTVPRFTVGQAITALAFTNNGGVPSTTNGCQSDPLLPNGLNISLTANNQSCQITGAPSAVTAQRNYRITAVNDNGSSIVTISVVVESAPTSGVPVLAAPTAAIPTLTVGEGITPIVFVNSGGSPNSSNGCKVTPALPPNLSIGLSEGGGSCQITGNPSVSRLQINYMITAENASGTSMVVTVSITVNAATQ